MKEMGPRLEGKCIVRYHKVGAVDRLEVIGHEWHVDVIGCIHCGLLIRGNGVEFVRPVGQKQPIPSDSP